VLLQFAGVAGATGGLRTTLIFFALLAVLSATGCEEPGLRVDPQCLRSHCREFGYCTFDGDKCVVGSDADCAQSAWCKIAGWCSAPASQGAAHCAPGPDEGCRQSDYCRDFGACTLVNNACRPASDSDCQSSVQCYVFGRCTYGPDGCFNPGEKPDGGRTRRSMNGRSFFHVALFGACLLLACQDDTGLRVDPECEAALCRRGGFCTFNGHQCLVGSDSDCRQSLACATEAKCTKVSNGACAPRSDDDCARSDLCADYGQCVFRNGVCRPGSDQDCAGSTICRVEGKCVFVDGSCTTQAP
jgi:hypothetical protein